MYLEAYDPHAVYIPHLPCELQSGHRWERIVSEDILKNTVKLQACIQCGQTKPVTYERTDKE